MTHAGATQSQLLLDVQPYIVELMTKPLKTSCRFTNNPTVPTEYRETNAAHVAWMLSKADALGLSALFGSELTQMIKVHDVPEIFGEPKTPNGFLFNGLTQNNVAEFEKRVLRVAVTHATMAFLIQQNDHTKPAEPHFNTVVDFYKQRINMYHTDSKTPIAQNTIFDELLDIEDDTQQLLNTPLAREFNAFEQIDSICAIYDDYTNPNKRQHDPLVATVKLLDKWSGISQLCYVARNLPMNMEGSPKYALESKNEHMVYASLTMPFTPSSVILSDACDFKMRIDNFKTATKGFLKPSDRGWVAQQANNKMGQFLQAARPFYDFSDKNNIPNWDSSAASHVAHYQKFLNGELGKAIPSKLVASFAADGYNFSDYAALTLAI